MDWQRANKYSYSLLKKYQKPLAKYQKRIHGISNCDATVYHITAKSLQNFMLIASELVSKNLLFITLIIYITVSVYCTRKE